MKPCISVPQSAQLRYVGVLVALALAVSARAADFKETARTVAGKIGASVVTVRVVSSLKMNFQGQNMDQEQKNEVPGTVVDPGGLTLVSASALDPSELLKNMLRGAKLDVSIKETTLILADGTEVPAEVVLKDTDLDMALVRPKDAGKTFEAVGLKARAAPAKILDDVFSVGRMGKSANRTNTVDVGFVRSYVKGPRPYYICSSEVTQNPGCIVFTGDGEPLGVVVTKVVAGDNKAADDETGMGGLFSMGSREEGPLPIVRPVEDLLDLIKQAKEAKPKPAEEKKAEPAQSKEK